MNKAWLKLIRSLHVKKHRKNESLFLVEGEKSVVEAIQSRFTLKAIFFTNDFQAKYTGLLHGLSCEKFPSKPSDLERAGTFQTNDQALAVVHIEDRKFEGAIHGLNLLLDDINDPGNLGTIIRVADWYGVQNIFCSETTADMYNPKVISASKGSFSRVNLYYIDPLEWLKSLSPEVKVYGTFMDGENIHKAELSTPALVVMGNEANGIKEELENLVAKRLAIPRFGQAESLNVGVATAIVCDHFMR